MTVVDELTIALSQISYLVATLSKRNFKTCVQEITELVSSHGQEADRYLLRCLLDYIDLNSDAIRTPSSKDYQQVQLLSQECGVLLRKPSLISVLVHAVDKTLHLNKVKDPAHLLPSLIKILKLGPVQEVVFSLTLLHSSYPIISESALQLIKQKLPELITCYSLEDRNNKLQEGGLHDSTPEVLHFILTCSFTPKDQLYLGITAELKELFLNSLRRDYPRELVPVVLTPLLYPDTHYDFSMDKLISDVAVTMPINPVDNSLHSLIQEVGYAFCSSLEDGREHMNALGMHDLPPDVVARILIMMVRTHSGIDDLPCSTFWATSELNSTEKSATPNGGNSTSSPTTANSWNIEVFVQILKEFSPNLSWIDVIRELDNGELLVKDRQALILLFTALRLGLQSNGCYPDRFPIDLIYSHWKHPESQFTVINQILKNQDIFSFADYNFHPVAIDMLKSVPETDNKDVAVWRSLDLVELLLHLSDRGMVGQVQELLKFPIQNCPDILLLALVQINRPMTLFQSELMGNLMPLFLANHPNSGVVLHQAWNSNPNVKQIVVKSMSEWYVRGDYDQTRLSRILDIAHDLKALPLLLNSQLYPLVIDLACLASRREYLKLEKWIADKIRDYGDIFVSALIQFLQRRCPQLFCGTYKEENFPKGTQLPQETIVTILTCLQAYAGTAVPEVAEAIVNLMQSCNFLNKRLPSTPTTNVLRGVGGNAHRSLAEPTFGSHSTLFPTSNPTSNTLDPLNTLGTSLSNLNLSNSAAAAAAAAAASAAAAFNLPASLGPLVSTPGSPSRLIGPSQTSSYQMLPHLTGGNMGATAQVNHAQMSLVSNSMAALNNLARITPQSQSNAIEKLRIGNNETNPVVAEFCGQISKEVEDEANTYFRRIYNKPPHPTLTPEDFIAELKRFHQSSNKRETELFACIIRNLFDEYKFYGQYPDTELFTTAQIFGGVLAHGLLTQTQMFSTGLKYILDALRKTNNTKMYAFGICALEQLKPILKDIPKMCEYLMNLGHFPEFPPALIEYIEYGYQGQEPPHKVVSSILTNSQMYKSSSTSSASSSPSSNKVVNNARPSIAIATNIDTLLSATESDDIVNPPDTLQDKIAFTFNNLSQLNLNQKSEELRDLIHEEHYKWLAYYLVMKRVSIELNFHQLYSNFLDSLKMPELEKLVLKLTYLGIKVLLDSDKQAANFSDRSILKNMGHWLGLLTLAKGKPILIDAIDFPMLLIEAYQKGSSELLFVIPFVAKVLESCVRSNILKPPNPWTLTVMHVLAEIHQDIELKLNLKFEIEVLCKTLQLDLKDLKYTTWLKEGSYVKYMTQQLSNGPRDRSPTAIVAAAAAAASSTTSTQSLVVTSSSPSPSINRCSQEATDEIRIKKSQKKRSPWVSDILIQLSEEKQKAYKKHIASPQDLVKKEKYKELSKMVQARAKSEKQIYFDELFAACKYNFESVAQSTSASVSSSSVPSPAPLSSQNSNEDILLQMASLPLVGSATASPVSSVHSQTAEPKYNLMTFNINTIQALGAALTVNAQLPLFVTHPTLKQCVRPIFERALQEWYGQTVERSVKISVSTTAQIVKTDFALDPEDTRIRMAAHYMARNLAAGMAMISCRDQIMNVLSLNLKNAFIGVLVKTEAITGQNLTAAQKEMLDQAVSTCVNDNMDLTCAYVQKQAIDKAVVEVDRHLLSEYEKRRTARSEGRRYCDAAVLTYQAERMPEQIRLKVGGVSASQMAVYEDYARNIPGFQLLTDREASLCTGKITIPPFLIQSYTGTDDISAIYDKVTSDLEQYIQCFTNPAQIAHSPQISQVYAIMESLIGVRRSGARDGTAGAIVIQKALDGLVECVTQPSGDPECNSRFRDFYLRILKSFQDHRSFGILWTNQKITKILAESPDVYSFNLDILECLLKWHLINLPQYDAHLAHLMESGGNFTAVAFVTQALQRFLLDERSQPPLVTEQDFSHTIEILFRILAHSRHPPEGLSNLVQNLRRNSEATSTPVERVSNSATAFIHCGILQSRECDDPPGFLEKTEFLLREWVNIYQGCAANKDHNKAFGAFVHQLNMQGFLKSDDTVTRFLRLCTQLIIDLYYRFQSVSGNTARNKTHTSIDGYVKLISLLIKHSGDATNTSTKLNLLNKIIGIITGVMLQDHEMRAMNFHQLPYHRLFAILFAELMNSPDHVLENVNFQILQSYAHTYHILRPAKVPGFAYSWLQLISDRLFVNRVLAMTPQQKGFSIYSQLIIDLFRFLAPFMRNVELANPLLIYYKGALRVLLILLHDFPEFLCEYYCNFCDVIPSNCIQLRNVILSSFPRNMRLPDPFTPNLKINELPEINDIPTILPTYVSALQPVSFKTELDSYLKARAPVTFLSELRTNLQTATEPGSKYNIPLMNALVLYVGAQAVADMKAKSLTPSITAIAHTAHMDIFQNLAVDLDNEGRYLFVNALTNQLRYPNYHTHYFSCTLLYLFAEANTEILQEQITRVIVERIIVNRPHPWGLLITFLELIKNPMYRFWEHDFVHCAPEIEKLFDSVVTSCVGRKLPITIPNDMAEI